MAVGVCGVKRFFYTGFGSDLLNMVGVLWRFNQFNQNGVLSIVFCL